MTKFVKVTKIFSDIVLSDKVYTFCMFSSFVDVWRRNICIYGWGLSGKKKKNGYARNEEMNWEEKYKLGYLILIPLKLNGRQDMTFFFNVLTSSKLGNKSVI